MKTLFAMIIGLVLLSGTTHADDYQVKHAGVLKDIMHKGDISAKFSLIKLRDKEGLYALGAMENLKGEIQIFDGVPFNSFAENGKLSFDNSFKKNACLIVYTQVNEWAEFKIPNSIVSRKQLENFIERTAKGRGVDIEKPFPFLIIGNAKSIAWHVVDWELGDMDHTHSKHIKSGPNGKLTNAEGTVLGFYSNKHKAIFTHHTTNMHMHFKTKDNKVAGHIDEIELGQNMLLKLPRTN
jgi:acetolactate decarboxylase